MTAKIQTSFCSCTLQHEIPGEGPGKAKGEGERGENALPEEWEETKIRVCSH